jgi:hypothetical protein
MDIDGTAFPPQSQRGIIQCMLLGMSPQNDLLEGLYLLTLEDGTFRRVGLFRKPRVRVGQDTSESAYNAWYNEFWQLGSYGVDCSYDGWKAGQDEGWVISLPKERTHLIIV